MTPQWLKLRIHLDSLPKDEEGITQIGPSVARILRKFADDYEKQPRKIDAPENLFDIDGNDVGTAVME